MTFQSAEQAFEELRRFQKNNALFVSDEEVWRELWSFWCKLEPSRCGLSEEQGKQLPTLGQMAATLFISAGRTLKGFIEDGQILAEQDLRAQRLLICSGIPGVQEPCTNWIPDTKRCFACGCKLVAKTSLLHERCPIGKW